MAVLSREHFDSIEFDAAASGEHAAAARTMTELAVTGTESAGMPRAEAFVRAGEQWLLADDPVALKEIVYEMRFDPVSARYAEFGPFFTGLVLPAADACARVGLRNE